jgi:hypothetical protein
LQAFETSNPAGIRLSEEVALFDNSEMTWKALLMFPRMRFKIEWIATIRALSFHELQESNSESK